MEVSDADEHQSMCRARDVLCSGTATIQQKMRALFYLRNIVTPVSAAMIEEAIFKNTSVLLKHEMAYVLGQMRQRCSIEGLIRILQDEDEDEIVRHEAAEALGNYTDKWIVDILAGFLDHKSAPLRDTCYLVVKGVEDYVTAKKMSMYNSVDPAVPLYTDVSDEHIEHAGKILLDDNACLYQKYRAMFYLRDCATDRANQILIEAFKDKSALLKHELAFIMGQMRMKEGADVLNRMMCDTNEHEMVRHEAAEALGAIATDECYEYLIKNVNDHSDIVRESVLVAMDILRCHQNENEEYIRATG